MSERFATIVADPPWLYGSQELLDVLEDDVDVDDVAELLTLLDYRGRYDSLPDALVGMKPPEFAAWLFRQLGARAGDELADLYPGSGAIGRAWDLYTAPEPSPSTRDTPLALDLEPSPATGDTARLASAGQTSDWRAPNRAVSFAAPRGVRGG